jgi:hypothetical protein
MKITKDNLQETLELLNYKVTPEFQFCPIRKYRADWKVEKNGKVVLIEYEGIAPSEGKWTTFNGKKTFMRPPMGHTTPQGFTKDCQKYNLMSLLGFYLLRYTTLNLNDDILNDLENYFK